MEEKKINIGAGDFPINGFINIDVYEGKGIDLVCNATKLPFKDNEVDYIYSGHCIEHNTLNEVRKILKECYRVLKDGCEIGIVVPEKDLTPKHMIDGEKFPDKPYKAHHSYWDLEMLKKEVKKAGFNDIEIMNIDTYPHLVARPHWQVGIVAHKKFKVEKPLGQEPNEYEINEHNKLQESWCENENKFVYNPTKKKHCPYCKKLFEMEVK